ncbi:queuosine precursor transporter [Pedobacter sp. SYSU D00535]|uniref:queuosine precursor transporter n=1 Tax=Pedobacter sp. SYSU D00535 TaxID=2810308 RepID=UPI001A958D1D|nr:queuosine precursor transporter [Pedobacter sp. SYSU D00535]
MTFKTPESRLFIILATFLVSNAILAEFIGVKIFTVEGSLGVEKLDVNLFGVPDLSFNMSAGVITWPLIFIMTDIINEYFGIKQVRFLSILTAILIAYAFLVVGLCMRLVPSDFWINQTVNGQAVNMDNAFDAVFGQGMWIICGSIAAFLIGQLVDVIIFHRIKKLTGEKSLWLRATGSTLASQCIDSFVVIFIAFYINPAYNWSWKMVAAIGLVNYSYKFIVALLMTPILYVAHNLIDKFLGKELASKLVREAAK